MPSTRQNRQDCDAMSHPFISSLLKGLYYVLVVSLCFILRWSGIVGAKYWTILMMFCVVYTAGYFIGRFEMEKKEPPK